MQEGTSLDPIFVGCIDLKALGAGLVGQAALTTPGDLAADMIDQHLMGKWEDALRVQMVLAVAFGFSGLCETVVDLASASAPGMTQNSVEDTLIVHIPVESKILEIVQCP